MSIEKKGIKKEFGLLELSNHFDNVGCTFRIFRYSRDSFY
jgi:hypothetical protein